MVHLSKMRENHLEYSSELARYSNEVTTTYKETPRTDAENKSLTDLALRGLHLLSDWTCVVTELTSWKLLHPTDHHQNNDCPSEVKPISKNMSRLSKYYMIRFQIVQVQACQTTMIRFDMILHVSNMCRLV